MRTYHIAVGVIAATLAVSAPAQQTLEQRLESLDQEVHILKRERELEQEAAKEKAKKAGSAQSDEKGFGLKSADGAFQLKLRGYVQADARFFLDDTAEQGTDQFLLRRVRPILEGTLHEDFAFRIMPDFGGGSTSLQDAYVEWRHWPLFQVRAGKFKAPVSLERLQSGTDIRFAERAFPTSLAPNRDVGLQVSGDLADGVIGYALGVFNGARDGGSVDGDTNDDKSVAARVFLNPFKKTDIAALQGLGIGVAGSAGKESGTQTVPGLPSFSSPGQNRFFSYITSTNAPGAVVADGNHTRIYPQAYYSWGRLGVLAEYVVSEQDVARGPDSATLEHSAWQVAASLFLTDDKASFKAVGPRKPFNPATGDWGAWELVARISELDIDDATFPTFASAKSAASKATATAVGLNWHLNRNVLAKLDYEQTEFEGGADKGADRPDEKVVFARLQAKF